MRGGYACGGYERDLILVHADASGKGSYPLKMENDSPRLQRPDPLYTSDIVTKRTERLNRTALELQLFEGFWDTYLPKRTAISITCVTSFAKSGTRWAEYTLDCVPRSEVTRCALLALSTSKYGRDTQDKSLTRRGLELYGKALSLFAKELKAPGRVKSFEVLNCSRILALYEVCQLAAERKHGLLLQQLNDVSSAAANWKGHIRGLLNLVQMHHPEAFSHSGAHEVFLETRYAVVTCALSDRTATFLSTPEWMSGPWKNRKRGAIDTIMDILVKIPGVLAEWDRLNVQGATENVINKAKAFRSDCLEIDSELRTWYSNFAASLHHKHPLEANIMLKGISCPKQQSAIPDILADIGIQHLQAMTIYWTSCTILHAIIDLVKNILTAYPGIRSGESDAQGANIPKYLICLGYSARYFLKSELGLLGTLSISHAGIGLIRTLHAHLSCSPKIDPGDLEQLRIVMGEMRQMSGFHAWKMWKCGMDDMSFNKSGTYAVR